MFQLEVLFLLKVQLLLIFFLQLARFIEIFRVQVRERLQVFIPDGLYLFLDSIYSVMKIFDDSVLLHLQLLYSLLLLLLGLLGYGLQFPLQARNYFRELFFLFLMLEDFLLGVEHNFGQEVIDGRTTAVLLLLDAVDQQM